MDGFIAWFQSKNGTLDHEAMGLVEIPGHGRGAVALKDIPVRLDYVLDIGRCSLTHSVCTQ